MSHLWWIVRWDVTTPAEWLHAEGTAEDMLPSDTLLTEKMVKDEDFDMATAPATSPAPRKIYFFEELCAAKMPALVPYHSTLQK